MIKLLTLLILGYMIIIMSLTIHFKADEDNPLMLLYPLIVAFYGWMAVVCREKWMFLPLFLSMGFEILMAGSRLMYIDVVTKTRNALSPNDPSLKIVSDLYPAFVAEVNGHSHSAHWFRMREFVLFLYFATLLFCTLLDIDLINRERQEGAYRNQLNPLDILAARDNADVVGADHPDQPPPSYEVVCADHASCPIIPSTCGVVTLTSLSELPPSYGEAMKLRKEASHIHLHHQQTSVEVKRVTRSSLNTSSCSTARFSAAASTIDSSSSCSLRNMPSCTTPSAYETGDFEYPTPLIK